MKPTVPSDSLPIFSEIVEGCCVFEPNQRITFQQVCAKLEHVDIKEHPTNRKTKWKAGVVEKLIQDEAKGDKFNYENIPNQIDEKQNQITYNQLLQQN